MKNKTMIRLTESELHEIVRESVYTILEQQSMVNEGWLKNAAIGGAIGLSTMFGGQNANAQNTMQQNTKQDSVQVQQQQFSEKELINMFKAAYKDRKKSPEVWQQNKNSYVATLPNGKISLVGQLAASHGQNPWEAITKKYLSNQNDQNIFSFGDFDIQ